MKQITRHKKVSDNVMSDELNVEAHLLNINAHDDVKVIHMVFVVITITSSYIELVHTKNMLSK